jgi:hypothetical protein
MLTAPWLPPHSHIAALLIHNTAKYDANVHEQVCSGVGNDD